MRGRVTGMIALAIGLALTGCGGGQHRDKGAPITSMALFDPVKFAGNWHEVGGFGSADCDISIGQPTASGFPVAETCRGAPRAGVGRMIGPGRFVLQMPGDGPAWVLWVDEGYRTAVLGTPSGAFGRILNRTPEIPGDRLTAARDVLRFNGYDTGALVLAGGTGA